ncbi:hypothetical protein ACPZ19_31765 [Amycolatopsis lurida]
MFYAVAVRQISFFSVEASGPRLSDLAGVLCAQGRATAFGRTAARLQVVVEQSWRARLLAAEFAWRGVRVTLTTAECGRPLVRTAFQVDLLPMANAWLDGDEKVVPPGFRLDGGMLRLWALASGRAEQRGYFFPFDAEAPQTHAPLTAALAAAGVPGPVVGPRGGGPAVRVTGRRRLDTLTELIGDPPPGAETLWPGGAADPGNDEEYARSAMA